MCVLRSRRNAVDLGLSSVVLIWAISPSLFKFALEEMAPFAFTYLRFLLMSVISSLVILGEWPTWRACLSAGAAGCAAVGCFGDERLRHLSIVYIVGLNLTT